MLAEEEAEDDNDDDKLTDPPASIMLPKKKQERRRRRKWDRPYGILLSLVTVCVSVWPCSKIFCCVINRNRVCKSENKN